MNIHLVLRACRRVALVIVVSWLVLCSTKRAVADMTLESFTHTVKNTSGALQQITDSSGVPLPSGTTIGLLATTSTDFTRLTSRSEITISVSPPPPDGSTWESTVADASATSVYLDTATVQGTSATSGEVVFTWAVTGMTSHQLTTQQGSVEVVDYFTHATMTAKNVNGSATSELLDDLRQFPGSEAGATIQFDGDYNPTFPGVADFPTFSVPFGPDREVSMDFELTTTAHLDLKKSGSLFRFDAVLDSDFSNTAILQAVAVYDMNGVFQSGATLVSENFTSASGSGMIYPTAVPEPSIGIWLSIGGVLLLAGRNLPFVKRC